MGSRRRAVKVVAAMAAVAALALGLLLLPGAPRVGPAPGGGGKAPAGPSPAAPLPAPPRPPAAVPPPGAGEPVKEDRIVSVRVVDGMGRPLPGAEVLFLRDPEDSLPPAVIRISSLAPDPGPAVGRLATDAGGRGVLGGLPAGFLRVRAAVEGRCTAEEQVYLRPEGCRRSVELRLGPACSLEGRVLTSSGEPVVGARVVAKGWAEGIHGTATDGEGRYRLAALPPGTATLSVVLEGRVALSARTLTLPSVERFDLVLPAGCSLRFLVRDGADGSPVAGVWVYAGVGGPGDSPWSADALAPTDAGGIVVFRGLPAGRLGRWEAKKEGAVPAVMERDAPCPELLPDRETVVEVALARGGRIRGSVRSADGTPVEGADVVAYPESDEGWEFNVRTESGPDGRFLLSGVRPGPCGLHVRGRSFLDSGRAHVEVAAGEEAERDFVLRRGAVIEGTVMDGKGRPLPGIDAVLQEREGDSGWISSRDPSDADGRFRIEGVLPGSGVRVRVFGSAGESGISEPFPVPEGDRPVHVVVTALPGATVAGRIRVEGGPLPPSAEVLLGAGFYPGLSRPAEPGDRVAAAEEDGTFRLEGVRPGNYLLWVTADGFLPEDPPRCEVAAGQVVEGIEVLLVPATELRGRVVDEEGRPLPGAAIRVSRHMPEWLHMDRIVGEGAVLAVSGPDGRFTVGGLWKGEYDVLADLDGRYPGAALGESGGGESVIVLHRTGTLAGLVVAAGSGAPLPGIPLAARQQTGYLGPVHEVRGESRADGTFLLDGLDGTRTCDLLAGREDGLDPGTRGLVPVEIQDLAVGARGLRVELSPGLSISGRVLDGEGGALAEPVHVRVDMVNPFGDLISPLCRDGEAGKDGSFSFEGLPKGKYRLSAWSSRRPMDLVPAALDGVPAGTAGVVLRLHRGVFISGTVVDGEGNPVESGWVHYGPPGTSLRDMGGDADSIHDGRFEAGPLLPGTDYDLVTRFCDGFLEARVAAVPAGSVDVVIELERAGRISGRVLDPDGLPVGAGVPVRALAEGVAADAPGAFGWERTDESGEFQFEDLGPYRFRVYAGGTYASEEVPDFAPVASGPVAPGTAGLEVRTRPGARLRVLLVDGARKAREVFYVVAAQPGLPGLREFTAAGDDGVFTLVGLVPGRIVLTAETRFGETFPLGEFEAPSADLRIPAGGE